MRIKGDVLKAIECEYEIYSNIPFESFFFTFCSLNFIQQPKLKEENPQINFSHNIFTILNRRDH